MDVLDHTALDDQPHPDVRLTPFRIGFCVRISTDTINPVLWGKHWWDRFTRPRKLRAAFQTDNWPDQPDALGVGASGDLYQKQPDGTWRLKAFLLKSWFEDMPVAVISDRNPVKARLADGRDVDLYEPLCWGGGPDAEKSARPLVYQQYGPRASRWYLVRNVLLFGAPILTEAGQLRGVALEPVGTMPVPGNLPERNLGFVQFSQADNSKQTVFALPSGRPSDFTPMKTHTLTAPSYEFQ